MRPHVLNSRLQSVTNPLVRRVVEQEHQSPDDSEIRTLQLSTGKQNDDCLSKRLEQVNSSQSTKDKRAVELATEKGSYKLVDCDSQSTN